MTREKQMINGFTEMMKAFWGNQDLQAPSEGDIEKIKQAQIEKGINDLPNEKPERKDKGEKG